MDDWRTQPPQTKTGFIEEPATPDQAARLSFMLDRFPRCWVTFRDGPKIDLDRPYSNFFTPHAVYGLDTAVIAAWADRFVTAKDAERRRALFHTIGYVRRPHMALFDVDGVVLSAQSGHAFPDLWEKLVAALGSGSLAAHVVERWAPRRSYDPGETFRATMFMTEQCADALVGAEKYADAFTQHPDKPRVWREIFKALGIDAVEDRGGVLTGDCGPQIAVLNLDAIRVRARAANPAAAPACEPVEAHDPAPAL